MKKILFSVLSLFLLASCASNPQGNSESCTLHYFEADSTDRLMSISETVNTDAPAETVKSVYSLLTKAEDKNLSPIVTPDIKLHDASVADGVCTLVLSERYLNLPDYSRTAVNACLVKTLCSLSYIDRVVISCEGASLEYTEADFITETPRTHYDTHTVNLYFANEAADSLQADRDIIYIAPDTTLEYAVVSRLLRGPASEKLKSAIPAATRLNSVYVSEDICVIDLSGEFVTNVSHNQLSESLALYSIVNTVTELPMINSVKFLIDGEEGFGYAYFDLSKPLSNAAALFDK